MQIPTRFSIAIHICMCLEFFNEDSAFNKGRDKSLCKKITSEVLAESVGVNAVIIRNILGQLKKAKIIDIARGTQAHLIKSPSDVSLLDIFYAVQSCGSHKDMPKNKSPQSSLNKLFAFHTNPNMLCPLGKHIHSVLDSRFQTAQAVLENYLASVSLQTLMSDLNRLNHF